MLSEQIQTIGSGSPVAAGAVLDLFPEYVGLGAARFDEFDCDALDRRARQAKSFGNTRAGRFAYPMSLDLPLAITSDSVMWIAAGSIWSGLFAYDLLQSTPKQVLEPNGDYFFYSGPWAAVSPNGC